MAKLRIFVLALLSLWFVVSVDAEEGLVAYYSFDEGSEEEVMDRSGRNNNANVIGGVKWVEGKFGKALEFDGEKSGLNCGNPKDFNMGTGDFTVELWIKTTVQAGKQSLVSKMSLPLWMLGIDNGKLSIGINDGEIAVYTNPNAPNVNINDGVWHHIALVVDRSNTYAATAYVDGKQDFALYVGEVTGILDNTRFLAIGYDWCNPFKGTIDELRIYKKALNTEEVKAGFLGRHGETVF